MFGWLPPSLQKKPYPFVHLRLIKVKLVFLETENTQRKTRWHDDPDDDDEEQEEQEEDC